MLAKKIKIENNSTELNSPSITPKLEKLQPLPEVVTNVNKPQVEIPTETLKRESQTENKKPKITNAPRHVYVDKEIEIMPNSISFIRLRVQDIEKGKLDPIEGIIEPMERFIERTETFPVLRALVKPEKNGKIFSTIMNISSKTVKITKNRTFGTFTPVTDFIPFQRDK